MFGIELAKQTMFLMGISFMLGSLFTVFVLLILEMLRVSREAHDQAAWEEDYSQHVEEEDESAEDRAA